jgi:hypothetical protein
MLPTYIAQTLREAYNLVPHAIYVSSERTLCILLILFQIEVCEHHEHKNEHNIEEEVRCKCEQLRAQVISNDSYGLAVLSRRKLTSWRRQQQKEQQHILF